MKVTRIDPDSIVLLATNRCTSACDNCCFGCNPEQGRTMTFDEMRGYVDKILAAFPDTITSFHLTGGECMLLGRDVDRIFHYATSRGLECGMVSNAFWATTYDKALRTLSRLKENGLRSVSFSTGCDHDRYVPWRNVRRAALAAARLGIIVDLRVEVRYGDFTINNAIEWDPEIEEQALREKLVVTRSRWMVFNNETKKTRNNRVAYYDYGHKERCRTLFESIIVGPYGDIYACCGLGMCRIPQMRLGNINDEPILDIYDRAFDDAMKIRLFTYGPDAILRYVHGKTGQNFYWHSPHLCDTCRVLFMDKTIAPVLSQASYEEVGELLRDYESIALITNDTRRNQKKASLSKADRQPLP